MIWAQQRPYCVNNKIRFNSGLKRNFLSRIRFVSTGTIISKRHSVSSLAGTGILKQHSVAGYTGAVFWLHSGIWTENPFPVVSFVYLTWNLMASTPVYRKPKNKDVLGPSIFFSAYVLDISFHSTLYVHTDISNNSYLLYNPFCLLVSVSSF